MKLKLVLLIMALPFLSFGQGVITVFSEDGDRFYLVLNGIKQNSAPQTNVRVDGLNNDFYEAKILFEDANKPEIGKRIPTKDPSTSQFAEVTYKIKRTKDGDLKLRYFGATPVPATYNAPADMYATHFTQTAPPPPPQGGTTVTRTTVTTTTNNAGDGGGSISFGVNGGGVNMNINMSDPNMTNQTTTTTTRTTTTQTTTDFSGGYNSAPPPPPAPQGCQSKYPMDWNSFKSAKSSIESASFEDTKMSTAKTICGSNCLSTDQVIQICNLFSFEDTKLSFAKFAYSKTTDPGNYFKVGNVFSFDASKTDLNNFINQGH